MAANAPLVPHDQGQTQHPQSVRSCVESSRLRRRTRTGRLRRRESLFRVRRTRGQRESNSVGGVQVDEAGSTSEARRERLHLRLCIEDAGWRVSCEGTAGARMQRGGIRAIYRCTWARGTMASSVKRMFPSWGRVDEGTRSACRSAERGCALSTRAPWERRACAPVSATAYESTAEGACYRVRGAVGRRKDVAGTTTRRHVTKTEGRACGELEGTAGSGEPGGLVLIQKEWQETRAPARDALPWCALVRIEIEVLRGEANIYAHRRYQEWNGGGISKQEYIAVWALTPRGALPSNVGFHEALGADGRFIGRRTMSNGARGRARTKEGGRTRRSGIQRARRGDCRYERDRDEKAPLMSDQSTPHYTAMIAYMVPIRVAFEARRATTVNLDASVPSLLLGPRSLRVN
ncbi:hypothetical protein DFH09DRAFT_1277342 [Mycena vulgaris]|nr:hypothetical protein DFH09DRAFT_1277342 [Mycena vulgaris]